MAIHERKLDKRLKWWHRQRNMQKQLRRKQAIPPMQRAVLAQVEELAAQLRTEDKTHDKG